MTAQNDAELMRHMISLLETKTTDSPQPLDHLDEDLGLMRRLSTKFKGMFSKQQRGVSDVLRGAAPLLKLFQRYMGRKNQTFENLTWQTVITFMASNAATAIPVGKQRGVPLNMAQLGEVLDDPTFRNSMVQQLRAEKVEAGSLNSWFPTAANLAAKRSQVVGGPSPTDRAKRTEVIMNSFLEAVVSKMFDLVDAAAQEPAAASQATAPAQAAPPAQATQAGPQATQAGGQTSQAAAQAPAFSSADLPALQALLRQLGGRPRP